MNEYHSSDNLGLQRSQRGRLLRAKCVHVCACMVTGFTDIRDFVSEWLLRRLISRPRKWFTYGRQGNSNCYWHECGRDPFAGSQLGGSRKHGFIGLLAIPQATWVCATLILQVVEAAIYIERYLN